MEKRKLSAEQLVTFYNEGMRDFWGVTIADDDEHECSLDDAPLAGIDLSYADLTDVSFARADLREANFAHATLASVSFKGADLRGADFSHTSLNYVNLVDAKLDGATMIDLKGFEAILMGASFVGATISGMIDSVSRYQIAALLEAELLRDHPTDEQVQARKQGIVFIRRGGECWEGIVTRMRRKNPAALAWGLTVLYEHETLRYMVENYRGDMYLTDEDIGVRYERGEFSHLRAGDKVIVRHDRLGMRHRYSGRVARLYPSGVLEVAWDNTLSGFLPSGESMVDGHYTLIPWTQGIEDELEAERVREKLADVDWDDVQLHALWEIVRILRNAGILEAPDNER